MSIRPRAICGALALAVIVPAVASAQPERNPFADLFGRAPDRSGGEFTAVQFRTTVGAQTAETLDSNIAEASALPDGLAGGADASLDIDYVRRRVQAGTFANYSYQAYDREPAFGVPAFDGGGRINIDATTRLSFQAGGRYSRSPFYRLAWLAPEPGSVLTRPADRAALLMMRNDSFEANAGIASRYTKRSTLSAEVFTRETRFDRLPGQDFAARGFRGQWKRQMSRDLGVHAGYGREELRPRGGAVESRFINELIDIGVDYARSLRVARRTTVGFSTETSMMRENDGPHRFRVNGSINLERYFHRTWQVQLGARRATEFLPGFRAPVFTERGSLSLAGHLAKRLILNLHADAGQGEVAFYDSRKFVSYAGDARLTMAVTRHLGFFTQYLYYQFRNPPDPALLTFVPRLSRQAVSVGVQAWVPIFDKEKVTSDTR